MSVPTDEIGVSEEVTSDINADQNFSYDNDVNIDFDFATSDPFLGWDDGGGYDFGSSDGSFTDPIDLGSFADYDENEYLSSLDDKEEPGMFASIWDTLGKNDSLTIAAVSLIAGMYNNQQQRDYVRSEARRRDAKEDEILDAQKEEAQKNRDHQMEMMMAQEEMVQNRGGGAVSTKGKNTLKK